MAADPRVDICLSKTPYRSKRVADRMAEILTERFGIIFTTYECGVCYQFHHTSGGYVDEINEVINYDQKAKQIHAQAKRTARANPLTQLHAPAD